MFNIVAGYTFRPVLRSVVIKEHEMPLGGVGSVHIFYGLIQTLCKDVLAGVPFTDFFHLDNYKLAI